MVNRLKKFRLGTRRRSTFSYRPGRSADAHRRAHLESLEPRIVLANDPFINEFQAINVSTLQDEDGDYEDWIEIKNPDVRTDLGGWYLTDDRAELRKWRFPAGTVIEPGGFLVVFASNKDRRTVLRTSCIPTFGYRVMANISPS